VLAKDQNQGCRGVIASVVCSRHWGLSARATKGDGVRRFITLAVACLAIGGAVGGSGVAVASPAASGNHVAVIAKTCSSGYTHAVIGGAQKCLHAGEYCSHSEARQYRRYHFACENVRGTYRLEHS
jgi:hypothetical protein